MASYKVGILGATGAVGEQMRIVLAERKFPISELRLFGSARSAGKVINYEGQDIVVQEASLEAFKGLDLLLGAADNPVAKQFLPDAAKMGIHVVDNSSAFRLDPDVPLVIPEVNPEDVKLSKGLIANPNCATIIGLTAVNSLHRHARIRRMVCDKLAPLGVRLDEARNEVCRGQAIISAPDSKVCVRVIPANEELGIARRTYELS